MATSTKFKSDQLVMLEGSPFVHKIINQTYNASGAAIYTIAVKDGTPLAGVLQERLTKA
jgi:hypothetical protein